MNRGAVGRQKRTVKVTMSSSEQQKGVTMIVNAAGVGIQPHSPIAERHAEMRLEVECVSPISEHFHCDHIADLGGIESGHRGIGFGQHFSDTRWHRLSSLACVPVMLTIAATNASKADY
jgi:hypothetical protein